MTHARKRLTKRQWGWLIFGLAYLICPLDFAPDFIPGGNLDDAAVMFAVVKKIIAAEESK